MRSRLSIGLWVLIASTTGTAARAIDVTAGTSGSTSTTSVSNQTRGVDVTVLGTSSLSVESLTLPGIVLGPATIGVIGARIYDSATSALIASGTETILAGSTVTVPLAATLSPGQSYRIAFHLDPDGEGIVILLGLFDPDPSGAGGFPYTESSGQLQINGGFSSGSDSFPSTSQNSLPAIQVQLASNPTAVPTVSETGLLVLVLTLAAMGAWQLRVSA